MSFDFLDWGNSVAIWIGGRQFYGAWYWEGTKRVPIEFTDWNIREPNSYKKDDMCLQVIGWPKLNWNDHECFTVINYVCEKRAPA